MVPTPDASRSPVFTALPLPATPTLAATLLPPTLSPTPQPTVTLSPTPTATAALNDLEIISPNNAARLSVLRAFEGLQTLGEKSLAVIHNSQDVLIMTNHDLLVWDLKQAAPARLQDAGQVSFSHAWAYNEQEDRLWWMFSNSLFSGPAASSQVNRDGEIKYASLFGPGCCDLIAISPTGRLLVWFEHTALRVINMANDASSVIYPPAGMQLQGFSPDGKLIYTFTDSGWLALYNQNGGWLRSFPLREGDQINFNADSSVIVALSYDNHLRLLNAKTGALIHQVQLQPASVQDTGFVFSPALDLAASIREGRDGKKTFLLWDINTGGILAALPSMCASCELDRLAFSPDGRLLVASHVNGGVQVWGIIARN